MKERGRWLSKLAMGERCTVEGIDWLIKGMVSRNFNITLHHDDILIF